MSLANGLFYPWLTMGLLSQYYVGRQFFTYGYQEKEGAFNPYRVAGSCCLNLAHLFTFCVSIFLGYRLATGRLVLQKMLKEAAKK